MSFEDFNFTRHTHCPYCKTSMIVIENKVVSCPLCELEKKKEIRKFERLLIDERKQKELRV